MLRSPATFNRSEWILPLKINIRAIRLMVKLRGAWFVAACMIMESWERDSIAREDFAVIRHHARSPRLYLSIYSSRQSVSIELMPRDLE